MLRGNRLTNGTCQRERTSNVSTGPPSYIHGPRHFVRTGKRAEVGGFNHLAMIGRSGPMTHAESEAGIKRLAKELLPRLREIKPVPVE